jgi:hypothetical protein
MLEVVLQQPQDDPVVIETMSRAATKNRHGEGFASVFQCFAAFARICASLRASQSALGSGVPPGQRTW